MPRHKAKKSQLKFDIPILDKGKPNSPYRCGARWTIAKHSPPPPFGDGYTTQHRRGPRALARMRQEKLPQSAYCFLNPVPGPEPPIQSPKLEIEVVEELRVDIGQGPQVVACRILNADGDHGQGLHHHGSEILVAKFYDPLYYHYNGEFDIVELADMEYSRESAAYRYLQQESVDGQFLPAYIGSYSLALPLNDNQKAVFSMYTGREEASKSDIQTTRHVRLIVTEKIDTLQMTYHLVFGDVNAMPEETRLNAIASTLEAYAVLQFHGIVHSDLAPRNVFLVEDKPEDGGEEGGDSSNARNTNSDDDYNNNATSHKYLRFHRFIDLGLAYILGQSNSAHPRRPRSETRPRNPIRLFWSVFESGAANMYYWLPPEMRNTNSFHTWMLQRWYGDIRFEPIGEAPEPSTDRVPWGTGQAVKTINWPADRALVVGATCVANGVSQAASGHSTTREPPGCGGKCGKGTEVAREPESAKDTETSQKASGAGFW